MVTGAEGRESATNDSPEPAGVGGATSFSGKASVFCGADEGEIAAGDSAGLTVS
jgi:hypothetical protein